MWRIESFWKNFKMPKPILEYQFAKELKRNWRIDYAWPDIKLAIEIEGGNWLPNGGGRHNRPIGFKMDMEKYNALTELGWHLLRYEPAKVDYGQIAKCYHQLKNNHEQTRNN